MPLSLKLVTPERTVYEDLVDSVSVMTEGGEIAVLPGHERLVANMRAGELRVRKEGKETYLVASTGFVEVRSGTEVVILADTAERVEELELSQIEAARDRARQQLAETRRVDQVAMTDAAAHLERELARHRVVLRHKHKTPHIPSETN